MARGKFDRECGDSGSILCQALLKQKNTQKNLLGGIHQYINLPTSLFRSFFLDHLV